MKKALLIILLYAAAAAIPSCKQPASEPEQNKEEAENTAVKELPSEVYYPDGFRNWTHVKSMILEEGHPLYESFGGIHHLYANSEAMQGYRSGTFPDGSVIVFDLFNAARSDNAVTEGERKVIGVMYKNAKAFPETGGWGFGGYKNLLGEKLDIDGKTACYNCHTAQKDKDFVFSSYRE